MSSTRLLILGVILLRQPIHGYDVRRELETWRAEQWANVAYGSIYFALNKLADEGLIEAAGTDRAGNRPVRTSYTITETGRREFHRLLHEAWWEPKPLIDPFQVALTFMNQLPRDELLAALRYRAARLQAAIEALSATDNWPVESEHVPRHIQENLRLSTAHMRAEHGWLDEAVHKVERDELP